MPELPILGRQFKTDNQEILLYYCQWTKQAALDSTKVYTDSFSNRLIPTFDNISVEAKKVAEERYQSLMSRPAGYDYSYDSYGGGDAAEDAQDAGIQMYENLTFVKKQLIGLSVAGLYHLWERTLRQFLCKELQHLVDETELVKLAKGDFKYFVKLLKCFSVDISRHGYYGKLNELRLVASTVKHGDARACSELIKLAPKLFENNSLIEYDYVRTADDLNSTTADFISYSNSITEFWMRLPQRMPLSKNATNP